jgi:dipeptidase
MTKIITITSWKGRFSACLLLFGTTMILLSNRRYQAKACTVFVVGKDASADGSVMCSHSNDGEFDTDPRLVKVPAGQYSPGDLRPIFFSPESYPRYVGHDRGIPEYYPKEGEPQHESFKPMGFIPQAAKTYAYLEQTYGAVNEMQVGIGESTCSGVFGARPIHQHPNGTALFSIDELSRIAMERASTAREAVVLMGKLAEAHGFYGAGEFEGTAESLAVTDPREAWMFHILPDPTGKSAIWAAERVDDDKFAVIANMFVIRMVDPEDTDRFLMSDSVHQVAIDYGWWTSVEKDGLLDFTKIYSDGEYAHKYYSGRRMWASYRLAAPSLALPSDYTDLQSEPVYPFAAVPDKPLSQRDLFRFHRDTLRGTQFDLSAEGNLAGGAFGSPDRWKAGPNEATKVEGNWERAIGLYRTSDTYVVQSKEYPQQRQQLSEEQGAAFPASPGAILWFGPASPLATIFTPFVVSMSDIPVSFRSGHQSVFSRESAFWAACYAHNIANLKWSYMIQDITKRQDDLETASLELVTSIGKDYYYQTTTNDHQNYLELVEAALAKNADSIVKSLWSLSDELVFRYADGFLNFPESEIDQHGGETTKVLGYPSWWLEAVGYKDGPPPPPTQPKCCDPPKMPRNIGTSDIKEPNATKSPPSSLLRGAETAMGIE